MKWLFEVLGCSRRSSKVVLASEPVHEPEPEPEPVLEAKDAEHTEAETIEEEVHEATVEEYESNDNIKEVLTTYLEKYLKMTNLTAIYIMPADKYIINIDKRKYSVAHMDFMIALNAIIKATAYKRPKFYDDKFIMFKSRKVLNKFKTNRRFSSEVVLNYLDVITEC
jgi:hypothetical protein